MSQDSSIYFWTEKFPYKVWRETLDVFTGDYIRDKERFRIRLTKKSAGGPYSDEWTVTEDHGNPQARDVIWISLHKFTENYRWNLNQKRPSWEIGLHWSSFQGQIDLPTLIPLAALMIFEGICFYNRNDKYYFGVEDYVEHFSLETKERAKLEDLKLFLIEEGKTHL